jgi:hypothetical protein
MGLFGRKSVQEDDPHYTRKPVPDELIKKLTPGVSDEEAFAVRDRKLSMAGPGGTDVRKFSNFLEPKGDPFYHRKPVPAAYVPGTGVPGLSEEEAFLQRERKLSSAGPGGTDVRQFSKVLAPKDDPFYQRKGVPKNLAAEEGPPLDLDPVTVYDNRERKLSMFQLGSDPFSEISGRRESIAMAEERRRSSAVAPDHARSAEKATWAHHNNAPDRLAPIESRPEQPVEPKTKQQQPPRQLLLRT